MQSKKKKKRKRISNTFLRDPSIRSLLIENSVKEEKGEKKNGEKHSQYLIHRRVKGLNNSNVLERSCNAES